MSDMIVIKKSFTNKVNDLVATDARENEHKMTFALKEEILTMELGNKPHSGDNIVKVKIKMPTGKHLICNFKRDDQVKVIYAFVRLELGGNSNYWQSFLRWICLHILKMA